MKKLIVFAIAGLLATACATPSFSFNTRPKCADLVAAQMATDQVVKGVYNCLSPDVQTQLNMYGEGDDANVAAMLSTGSKGSVQYLTQSPDGGYVYIVTSVSSFSGKNLSHSYDIHVDKNGKVAFIT